MEVFIWRPLLETPGETKFNVFAAQFGDGYKQTAGDGINNKIDSWNLTFKGKKALISQIKAFLDAHGGFIPFLWTPKGEDQAIFECVGYNRINHTENGTETGIWTLTAKFNQRFDL